MQTSLFRRFTAAAIVLVAGLGAAATAQARSDVSFSIGINVPGGYVQPAPVYVHSAPVYVQPQPVYVQPRPVYVQPRPVFVQPAPIYYQPRPMVVQQPVYGPYYGPGRGWDHDKRDRKHWKKHHGRGGYPDQHHDYSRTGYRGQPGDHGRN